MRHFLLALLVCALATSPLLSQSWDEPPYDITSCAQPLNTSLDTEAICRDYLACAESNNDYGDPQETCYFEAYVELLSQCQATDRDDCIALSAMHMTRLSTITTNYRRGFPEVDRFLDDVVSNYDAGETSTALALLPIKLETISYPRSFATNLMYGILSAELGQLEEAIHYYSVSLAERYDNPVVYYLRGQLYLETGDIELASRDFYSYNVYSSVDLKALVPVPEPVFMMPEELMVGTLYPVFRRTDSISGFYFQDRTLISPQKIQFVVLDEGNTIAITNAIDINSNVEDAVLFLSRYDLGEEAFIYNRPVGLSDADFSLILGQDSYIAPYGVDGRVRSRVLMLSTTSKQIDLSVHEIAWEMYHDESSIIRAITSEDPRTALIHPCEGLPMSWLTVGDNLEFRGRIGIKVYEEPNTDKELTFANYLDEDYTFEITGGPMCGDEYVWWEVSINDDQIGWIPDEYRLVPTDVGKVLYDRESRQFLDLDTLIQLSEPIADR